MSYAKGRNGRVAIFTLFSLIPISVSFLVPAIAYQWPLRINSLETGQDVVVVLQDDALLGSIRFYGLWILVFAVTVWGALLAY